MKKTELTKRSFDIMYCFDIKIEDIVERNEKKKHKYMAFFYHYSNFNNSIKLIFIPHLIHQMIVRKEKLYVEINGMKGTAAVEAA